MKALDSIKIKTSSKDEVFLFLLFNPPGFLLFWSRAFICLDENQNKHHKSCKNKDEDHTSRSYENGSHDLFLHKFFTTQKVSIGVSQEQQMHLIGTQ